MSQHLFRTEHRGQSVTILMGFDRPLQGYFMVIELDDADEDTWLYSNLEDPALIRYMGLPPTLEPFLERLAALGLQVPAAMVDEIRADGRSGVGNRYVQWNAQGAQL